MTDPDTLRDLARAKAAFQQRTLVSMLTDLRRELGVGPDDTPPVKVLPVTDEQEGELR